MDLNAFSQPQWPEKFNASHLFFVYFTFFVVVVVVVYFF